MGRNGPDNTFGASQLTLCLDLSAAVDVYSDWVDACDAVAKDTANQYDGSASAHAGNSKPDPSADVGHGDTYEEEDY